MSFKFEKFKQNLKQVRRLKLKIAVATAVIILIGCAAFSFAYINSNRFDPNDKTLISVDSRDRIKFEVPKGVGTSYVAGLLKNKGIIANTEIFKLIAKTAGYDGKFISGYHYLSKKMSDVEIMRTLSQKSVYINSVMVTIPENFTYRETVEKLSRENIIIETKFDTVANKTDFDYDFIGDIPERKHRLEGYLFPETYSFDGKPTEKEVLEIFLKQFNKIFKKEYYQRAKDLDMTVDQIITLASIVEKEAKRSDERAMIAGVFYNRLHSKIPYLNKLQSCATIQYIFMENEGKVHKTITLEDEKIDNPYNTYMYAGLPPGPICSPGESSIIAALYPTETKNLYFVAKDDGTGGHYFSETYQEHLQAIEKAKNN